VIRDQQGRILLVRPSYKPTWDLPGGGAEIDESPRDAAIREVGEELGVEVEPGKLLAVDWLGPQSGYTEVLALLFDAGTLSSEQASHINVDGQEIIEAAFHTAADAMDLLDAEAASRLEAALTTPSSYLENGIHRGGAPNTHAPA